MIVFQTDAGGVHVGAVAAEPSPREPGAWLIPAGCVTIAPPDLAEGEQARWTGQGWAVEPVPQPEPEPEPEPGPGEEPTLSDAVPLAVSRFQARAALLQAGLLEDVEAAVAGADALTRLAWADAIEFRRDSPAIAAVAAMLELDDEALDALFRTAAGIAA